MRFLALVLLVGSAVGQQSLLDEIEWREVGPYRGGRCAAVAGLPGDAQTYYMGVAGGGVWKTRDAGRTWDNVSDGFFGGSIGAVAVAESDPNVVYVGMGEKTVRGNVSHGDGVWKSTDAGRTWKHVGLADSRHVCRMRVHPQDPDVVYAAVLGHLFGPNAQRGVYRSRDGGESWEKVLFVSDKAGAVDLAMDPTNPRILYATIWQVRRTPYSLESGGPDCGIWKSTDSGATWTDLSDNEGLPPRPIGICGISVSASNPDNIYAIVEAEKGGVFRSRDAGETWTRTNDDRSLRQRAWYYTRLQADPLNEEVVYVLNVGFHRSRDGGKSFQRISVPHGDNHDLWIAPDDSQRMIQSNDGGANVSFDAGATWSTQSNQPTAQMYRVSLDNAVPYRLLGGQQDNSAVRIRSRSLLGGSIDERDWEPTAGGESGHIVAKPDDPDIVFGGSYDGYLTRFNHRTGERRTVTVWPDNPMGWGAAELKYRFQWNFPLFFSPHDPNVLYAAAQCLFRSTDLGASWEQISPDLTRDDKSRQGPSGGPITKDNTSVEYYCTIFAALESPHEPGVYWCGSDDGLLHLSRDGGANWHNVTPPAMPEWALINGIDAHPTEPGGLYVAATRYKTDDFAPYLYRTTDYGKTWTTISAGIDPLHFTRAIRADPVQKGLLYAGTERGVYVSWNDGASWHPMQGDLPVVPITDLAVRANDLVAATQGRGYWIFDDLHLLRQFDANKTTQSDTLFAPAPAERRINMRSGNARAAGTNPPAGAVFHYWLADAPTADTEIDLAVLDAEGQVIRAFTRKPDPDAEKSDDAGSDEDTDRVLDPEQGLNRHVWNLRYPGATRLPKLVLWNGFLSGPRALPGDYTVRLTVDGAIQAQPFEVVVDPLSTATDAERRAQFDFLLAARDKMSELHEGIRDARSIRTQIGTLEQRIADRDDVAALRESATALSEELDSVVKALYQTKNRSAQDPLNFPIRLNDKLSGAARTADSGDFGPTQQAREVYAELVAAIDVQLARLRVALEEELPDLNRQAREAGVPFLVPLGR